MGFYRHLSDMPLWSRSRKTPDWMLTMWRTIGRYLTFRTCRSCPNERWVSKSQLSLMNTVYSRNFSLVFRKHHSTETAILKVMSDILTATSKGNVTLLGLLDMSAAFDTDDHGILLRRLETSFGVSGSAVAWFQSFLHTRTQLVIFNELPSRTVVVTSGVPGLRPWTTFVSTLHGRYTSYSRWTWLGCALLRWRWSVIHLWQGVCSKQSDFCSHRMHHRNWWVDVIESAQTQCRQNPICLGWERASNFTKWNRTRFNWDPMWSNFKSRSMISELPLTTTYQWRNMYNGFASLRSISYVRSELSVHHWHEQHASLSCTLLYWAD